MRLSDLRSLLKNRRVKEEISRYLLTESQKAGYNIGIERATEEWLRFNAKGWMKNRKAARPKISKKTKRKKILKKNTGRAAGKKAMKRK